MNDKKFHELLRRLKDAETDLHVSHQSSSPQRSSICSVGFFNHATDVSLIPEKELPLAHSMLHMFYNGSGGRNLSMKTIEKLHADVTERLPSHKNFDGLDKNE